ncbi:MAG: hypothetical protein A2749_01680 [Parcubacteria group bacterium RIFCSPHIGHO2_01_FULL_45_26]|nr:MAG: hypothetical protein A2749_01680 [Parcubacteria group bacterium RIFCSPHIGHO2_01_FULL_45_26]
MKKLSIGLAVITITSLFTQPVFAYQTNGVNFGQVKTETTLNNSGENLNKINSVSRSADALSQDSSIIKKEKAGLEVSIGKGIGKGYVEGEILVKYRNNKINLNTVSGRTAALNFIRTKSLEKKEDLRKNNISVLRIKDAKTVEQKIAELKNDPNIEYAEPNYKRYPAVINTDDTNRGLLWGLDNTGQTVGGTYTTNNPGSTDKDIDGPEAWAISEATTSVSVIVAVIDSGVAYNHPDLAANMWNGTSCKDDIGVAITGGCNHGYDYEDGDNTPLPTISSHGTHIAGTIAAVKNNTKGIMGVAPQAKIMAIKYGNNIASEVRAIDFAIQNGAKVINASFTGSDFSQTEYDAINRFKTAGGIFVAAAGNETTNNESAHLYPSDYNLDNIISVAATDQNDTLATFSNYGVTSVDVSAPGTNIYSTMPQKTAVLSEGFEGLTPPAVPSGWIKSGANNNFGTYNLGGIFWGKVLYGDLAFPYANNTDTTIISSAYNLNAGGANIDFWTKCDTEYITNGWADYMQLEYSADGVNFLPAIDPYFGGEFRWDEPTLDILNGENPLNSANGSLFHYSNISIPAQYLTSNFKFRFHWVSNGSDNSYDGCLVDDVKITKFSDGSDEQYGYSDGTSMATPHVVGLAALIEGYNPILSLTQVKNAILTTGDSVASLSGKTVSGKRINAQNALQAVNPAKAITAFTIPSQIGTTTINESIHTIAVTVPFGTNVTTLVPTIVTSIWASVSPASGVAQDFTNLVTYTVTAADSSTQAYVVTVTVAPATNHTISGTVKYYDGVKVVPGAVVTLSSASTSAVIATTTTGGTGTYQFTNVLDGGNYTVSISKDDNFASTGVAVSDLIAIKKHTLGTILPDIYKQISADFNSSGSITVSDLILLKKFTLLRVDGRPASSWKFYSSNATLATSTYLTTGLARTIFNTTSDISSQDFIAIKMGDVNNSWTSN